MFDLEGEEMEAWERGGISPKLLPAEAKILPVSAAGPPAPALLSLTSLSFLPNPVPLNVMSSPGAGN